MASNSIPATRFKPCPHCGGGNTYEDHDRYGSYLACLQCGFTDNNVDFTGEHPPQITDSSEVKSGLDALVDILKVTRKSEDATTIAFLLSLESTVSREYLRLLSSGGYVSQRDGVYLTTERGKTAIHAYDEVNGVSPYDLAVLRQLEHPTHASVVSRRTIYRALTRLSRDGLVEDGKPTEIGKALLESTRGLFELVDYSIYLRTGANRTSVK